MEVNWALGLFGYPFINISYKFLNLLQVWKKKKLEGEQMMTFLCLVELFL